MWKIPDAEQMAGGRFLFQVKSINRDKLFKLASDANNPSTGKLSLNLQNKVSISAAQQITINK